MRFWKKRQSVAKSNVDEALSRALRFTEADLEANRKGQLTAEQASQIRLIDIINIEGGAIIRSATSVRAWNGASIVLAIFSFLVILGSLIQIATATDNQEVEISGVLILFAVVLAQMPIYNTLHYRKCRASLYADLEANCVEMIEGKLFLDTSHDRWTNRQLVRIQDTILFLPNDACFHAYTNFKPYRFYYLPRTQLVVSVEPLF